jgi:hypothetical protein
MIILKFIHSYPQRVKINDRRVDYTKEDFIILLIKLMYRVTLSLLGDNNYTQELKRVKGLKDINKTVGLFRDILVQICTYHKEHVKSLGYCVYILQQYTYGYNGNLNTILTKNKCMKILINQGRANIRDLFCNIYQLPDNLDPIAFINDNLLGEGKMAIQCLKVYKEEVIKYYSNPQNIISLLHLRVNNTKHLSKLVLNLIDILSTTEIKDSLDPLLSFYIKRLINPIYQETYKYKHSSHNSNFLSLFRINDKLVFYLYYEGRKAYSISLGFARIVSNFQEIFKKLAKIKVQSDRRAFWDERIKLESEFEGVLFDFQRAIFNNEVKALFKNIFLDNSYYVDLLSTFYVKNKHHINCDLNTFISNITDEFISYYPGKKFNNKLNALLINEILNNKSEMLNFTELLGGSKLFYYIVSAELANIPLENSPVLSQLIILRNFIYKAINPDENDFFISAKEVYCIVNPSKDLKDTEEALKPYLSSFNGVFGHETTKNELTEILKRIKILIYAGHNNGSSYINQNYLKTNEINFISMLMGCSSIKLENLVGSKNEPFDLVSHYVLNRW